MDREEKTVFWSAAGLREPAEARSRGVTADQTGGRPRAGVQEEKEYEAGTQSKKPECFFKTRGTPLQVAD